MKNKKSVLITGGAGFIGSNLCEKFIEEDWNVIAVDNSTRKSGLSEFISRINNASKSPNRKKLYGKFRFKIFEKTSYLTLSLKNS